MRVSMAGAPSRNTLPTSTPSNNDTTRASDTMRVAPWRSRLAKAMASMLVVAMARNDKQ